MDKQAHTAEAKVVSKHEILIPEDLSNHKPEQIRLIRTEDADIGIPVQELKVVNGKTMITVAETLDTHDHYQLSLLGVQKNWVAEPSAGIILMSTILAAALVNNFVFTRYLGLCVFFGVSKKKATALGMGATFTIVSIISGVLAWLSHQYVLVPYKLGFLSIIVFIGIIAFLVQALDTILKKIHPALHSQLGIYLVLITTNCIILAVPLINATEHASFPVALALSAGSGVGFALALFLMSCAREAMEVAPVPAIFKGLPIAFILAGLFALGFLGFSGLKLF